MITKKWKFIRVEEALPSPQRCYFYEDPNEENYDTSALLLLEGYAEWHEGQHDCLAIGRFDFNTMKFKDIDVIMDGVENVFFRVERWAYLYD